MTDEIRQIKQDESMLENLPHDTQYFTAKPIVHDEQSGSIFAKGSQMRKILRRILYVQEIIVILAILALILDYFFISNSKTTSGVFPILSLFSFSVLWPILCVTIIMDLVVIIYFVIKKK